MKRYVSVPIENFYQRTRFRAITLAPLKATMQNLFSGKDLQRPYLFQNAAWLRSNSVLLFLL